MTRSVKVTTIVILNYATTRMMELDLNTRDRLADILKRNLAALYKAKKDVEAEWDEIESERKDAEQRQEVVEENRRLIIEHIDECKELLKRLNRQQ